MIELGTARLPGEKARALLRKLRDLNLTSGPVAVSHRARVHIAGCLSLDAPVEKGVRYRVDLDNGATTLLELTWNDRSLTLASGSLGPHLPADRLPPLKSIDVPITCDRRGRACAPALGARVDPESCDRRALEHFLRRVVKTLFR